MKYNIKEIEEIDEIEKIVDDDDSLNSTVESPVPELFQSFVFNNRYKQTMLKMKLSKENTIKLQS